MVDQTFNDRLAKLYRAGNPYPHITPAQANVPILPVDDLEIHGAQPVPPISEDAMIQTISMLMARGPVKPHDIRCTEGGSLLTATTEGLPYVIQPGGGEYQGPFVNSTIFGGFSPTIGIYSCRFTWFATSDAMIADFIYLYLTDHARNILATLATEPFVSQQVGASFYTFGSVDIRFSPAAVIQPSTVSPPPYRLSASMGSVALTNMGISLVWL